MNAYVEDGYGAHMNRVREPVFPCPRGHVGEAYDVYEQAAVWLCGFVRPLPPVKQDRWAAARARRGQK